MKRIYKDVSGGHMWNVNKPRGPREIVEINPKTIQNSPETIGEMTINKENGEKHYTNRSGVLKLLTMKCKFIEQRVFSFEKNYVRLSIHDTFVKSNNGILPLFL